MRQIQIRRRPSTITTRRQNENRTLDLRTPSGRRLPF
jgi:hypothetical protein